MTASLWSQRLCSVPDRRERALRYSPAMTSPDATTPEHDDGGRRGVVPLVMLLAVLSAGTWFAWLGWDTTYDIDADGNQTGPYEAWQVIGAAVTLLVLTVLGALRLGTLPTALGVGIGFTAGWVATSAATDDSGLWVIGAVLVAFGVFLGAYGAAAAVEALTKRRSTRVERSE